MPEGVGYEPLNAAPSLGVGKAITYQGYGYYAGFSGPVGIDQSAYYDLLVIESPKQGMKAWIEFGVEDSGMATGEALHLQLTMNGNVIMYRRLEYTGTGQSGSPSDLSTPIVLTIPSLATVSVQAKTDHSSSMNAYATLAGKVLGAPGSIV
jgi:hypothetical protein